MRAVIAVFADGLRIVKANWITYVAINIVVYGTFAVGVVYAIYDPGYHSRLLTSVQAASTMNPETSLARLLFFERNIPLIILRIFVHNSFAVLLFYLGPSMIFPFAGAVLAPVRIFTVGATYGLEGATNILTVAVVILEEQAYIISMLAGIMIGTRFLFPRHYGFEGHIQGYFSAVTMARKLLVLIFPMLFVAASYEGILLGIRTKPVFPPVPPEAAAHFSGSFVKLPLSGAQTYYGNHAIQESDAKIVGSLLEDAGYFGPSRLSRADSAFRTAIYLQRQYWQDAEISRRLFYVLNKLRSAFPHRTFVLEAFCHDSLGVRVSRTYDPATP